MSDAKPEAKYFPGGAAVHMSSAPSPQSALNTVRGIERTMHPVNAAIIRTGAACDTWAQVVQWADMALGMHRKFGALQEEDPIPRPQQGSKP